MGTITRVTVLRTVSTNSADISWTEAGEFRDVGDACEVAKALARSGSYTFVSVMMHLRPDIRKGTDDE